MTLVARATAAELTHKAATVTFRTIHIAPAINSQCDQFRTKIKTRLFSSYTKKQKVKHPLCPGALMQTTEYPN